MFFFNFLSEIRTFRAYKYDPHVEGMTGRNIQQFDNRLSIYFPAIYRLFQMDVDLSRGEGFRSYYIQKIEELQLVVADKAQNLRRLQAQRNELNAKGDIPSAS